MDLDLTTETGNGIEYILCKMNNPTINDNEGIGKIQIRGNNCEISGNIMSLLYGDYLKFHL